jgi:hypothetical protein
MSKRINSRPCPQCIHEVRHGSQVLGQAMLLTCGFAGVPETPQAAALGYTLRIAARAGRCPFFCALPSHPDAYRSSDAVAAVPIESFAAGARA